MSLFLQSTLWLVALLPVACGGTSNVDAVVNSRGHVNVRMDGKSHDNSNIILPINHTTTAETEEDHGGTAIASWIKALGGHVHDEIDIRQMVDANNNNVSEYRLFVKADIPIGTPLLVLPKETLIMTKAAVPTHDEDKQCRRQLTARTLRHEMKLGSKSQYAPYIQYLQDASPPSRVPTAAWSRPGKQLLNRLLSKAKQKEYDIMDDDDKEEEEEYYWGMNIDLPPEHPAQDSLMDALYGSCDLTTKDMETEGVESMLLLHQHAWSERNEVMIPLYDMLQHRRGKDVNTLVEFFEDSYDNNNKGELMEVVIKSSRSIEKGEELFASYYNKEAEDYGTPELFRDFGIVEAYPRAFYFHQTDVQFVLDAEESLIKNKKSDRAIFLRWLHQRPYDEDIQFLKRQLQRLVLFASHLESPDPGIPDHEWELILQYYQAIVTAMDEAIYAYDDKNTPIVAEGGYAEYDMLEEKPDSLNYLQQTCDAPEILKFIGYNNTEKVQSQYQKVTFFAHNETNDTCFDLDGTVQICSSYRPHYHEMAVHYTARYLEKLERVLFVGGGDSMLLHEILKYDTLQKVVGLELDQKVTRKSFKHLGTQPHWDNPKVEWWFGDASKSLGMLPAVYFGSFDLVIMDLSETVMSLTVTDGLDIFGALALLLKPEGIIVKNEVYLEKFASLFDYTMQANLYGTPVVCSQVMVYGSYENDFLKRKPINHHVDTLLADQREDMTSEYGLWHDYRNSTGRSIDHCKEMDETKDEPINQTSSPGIIMVVEAEETSDLVAHPIHLTAAIIEAMKEAGFSPVSDTAREADPSDEKSRGVISVVLKEGYITARTWPNRKYCAFDIHLWSKFEKHGELKTALITAVGTPERASSSYRIVAGGMLGVASWKEDEKNRGPRQRDSACSGNHSDDTGGTRHVGQAVLGTILQESVELIGRSNISVAIVCGFENEKCESLEVASNVESIGSVIPLWACPQLEGLDRDDESGIACLRRCRADTFDTLEAATEENEALRLVVVDPGAPFAMGQVVVKLFSDENHREVLLADSGLVVATMQTEEDSWRRALIDRFRHDIIVNDPVFRAQAFFNDSVSGIELGIASYGDVDFIPHFKMAVAEIEEKTNLAADIRNIQGGLFNYQPDFDPRFFYPKDYDQTSPLDQWMSQKPLGFQTLFQLELQPWNKYTKDGDRVSVYYEETDQWIPGVLLKKEAKGDANDDQELFNVKFDDGDYGYDVHPMYMRAEILPKLSLKKVQRACSNALKSIKVTQVTREDFEHLGKGLVITASWVGGDATVLWDGSQHIDINLFTYKETVEVAERFVQSFRAKLPAWGIALRDEQPRGTGRVVNFQSDLQAIDRPHWAP
ncbi:Putrescine N-methyltransferase [Seminavis robusta]|uniref:Putrescine N-methyltransferase n=1 Tax=Seminavis robusta TaxID=568900 RepID=A0A9N8HP63_9STRA|nr:Putrescine N-methyltransferase [Seminavis robusta]|eukprot:Sro1041_g234570.1 Putrescine N-methyltransferase (1350) ;mRNA; r:17666-21715